MNVILNTGRTVTQGRHVESKGGIAYSRETGSCFMNPLDLLDLGIEEGECIEIRSDCGSVVVRTRLCEDLDRGMIFLPYGPFANIITPAKTHSTGMPDFKDTLVEITPTTREPLSAWDLMEEMGGVRYEG